MDFIILGAGRHATVTVEYLWRANNCVVGAVGEPSSSWLRTKYPQIPVERSVGELVSRIGLGDGTVAISAVGDVIAKQDLTNEATREGLSFRSCIHSSAVIADSAYIAEGCFIGPGVIVGPHVRIGRHVILNTSCVIDHDSVVGEMSTICPSVTICGNVRVGERVFVGTNATVVENIEIGAFSKVGAMALVNKDIPEYVVSWGIPSSIQRYVDN